MSVLTFGFYYNLVQQGDASRKSASVSMFVFAASSYFFSRFYRVWLDAPEAWELPATEYWTTSSRRAVCAAPVAASARKREAMIVERIKIRRRAVRNDYFSTPSC